nr:MAG TPA: hypothetical protein [Siphoviridae sp. cttiG1]
MRSCASTFHFKSEPSLTNKNQEIWNTLNV